MVAPHRRCWRHFPLPVDANTLLRLGVGEEEGGADGVVVQHAVLPVFAASLEEIGCHQALALHLDLTPFLDDVLRNEERHGRLCDVDLGRDAVAVHARRCVARVPPHVVAVG